MKVPFFRLKFGEEEFKSVSGVLKSGWVTTGPKTQELERRIARLAGAGYSSAVSSCSAGLFLTLKALSVGEDDEVITTPFTMVATVEAILHCGAKPIFADIDPVTLNIDAESVRKKITKKTKAILSVDLAGWPCDYKKLLELSRRYGLFLIDDAAHAIGAIYRNRPIGSIADATLFSFYSTKNITSGEGGMVVSNSRRLIDKIRHLSLHSMTSSGWKRYSGGGWRYDITDLGYKCNFSDLSAGLALAQLKRFRFNQNRREALACRYMRKLAHLDDYVELPYIDKNSRHAWHLFIIKLNLSNLKIGRDRFLSELEKNGVGCGVHFIPIYRFSYYRKNLRNNFSDYPACEISFKRIISLPFYPDLSFTEVDYVCETIEKLVKRHKR